MRDRSINHCDYAIREHFGLEPEEPEMSGEEMDKEFWAQIETRVI